MIKLQLVGRLGQNATENAVGGKKVINFSVAHNERYKNPQGVPQERTVWVNCSMWEPGAVGAYLVQGKAVYLEGVPWVNQYTSLAGEPKAEMKLRVTYLQLLPGPKPEAGGNVHEMPEPVVRPADDLPFE
ncbi:single-stranded DNA-binding protein [Chitinophaga alhagiae]|uniref:Single-stranded DNA-binding protein n=1 Tax=Chitinophaga alhagiae TaxID=2203219 RepID=A0ABN5LMA9_9BACT|nr:single-stranded DNA-binding protein [Chitinophaga alhagiae]AWO00495.1 single-stranded DNA-binding protein [Chitinophaga alhagiae]